MKENERVVLWIQGPTPTSTDFLYENKTLINENDNRYSSLYDEVCDVDDLEKVENGNTKDYKSVFVIKGHYKETDIFDRETAFMSKVEAEDYDSALALLTNQSETLGYHFSDYKVWSKKSGIKWQIVAIGMAVCVAVSALIILLASYFKKD